MKLVVTLEVSFDDDEVDEDELAEAHAAVVEYIHDDVFQTFSSHQTGSDGERLNVGFVIDEVRVEDTTDDEE